MRLKSLLLCVPFALSLAAADTKAEAVITHKMDNFPIAESVEINAGKDIIFLSGKVPTKKAADLPNAELASYGNTEEQTINVLEQIQAHLAQLGLSMEDVVKMQVFLVGGEETDGTMDFKGFMDGYTKFFDGKSSKLPARSAFQVAKLANPAWRVEIEVTAVRP
ncbi:RidA family protein [Wohlfahrtiimonas chitiniclastica]|uniref:RidA family protein n=1 Tax=Wohlfahrtiimonas chitiniclastica TaxID=400946 RepID=UPI0003740AA9|nr:RidA family protein [Wohlfahrtiimonas chitiniclastica]MBS7815792.1 RidA family protein [Wohlfahrtiimonas chitiniclastica]MBS7823294.1 RidA family protein [Wohlfahrtiimonas chitiniclastica]MBS7831144.1 RidA family protein [Wohlfahrtiimonas chitiniclastica]MBS7833111.1 RidA family protein [Wohlfahrtiimonas chitiniclastica]